MSKLRTLLESLYDNAWQIKDGVLYIDDSFTLEDYYEALKELNELENEVVSSERD